MDKHSGACHCGKIRFEVHSSPTLVEHCHCSSCRRLHGSAVTTLVGYARENITVILGTPVKYESSPGVYRTFCGTCGTRLFWESSAHDHEVYIALGAFDSPADFPADCHVWTSERLPWVEISDGLPQYDAFKKDDATD